MKLIKTAVISSLLSAFFVASTPIQAQETITILAEDGWPPFARADGTGITNSLVKAAYREVGIDVKYEVVPFIRLLKQLELGRGLAGFNIGKTPDVVNKYSYGKEPLFVESSDYFVLKDSPLLKYKERAQLPAKTRLGTIDGYMYGDFVATNPNSLVIQPVSRHDQNLKKMLAGRLDIVIMYSDVAKDLFKLKKYSDQLVQIFPGDNVPFFTAFSKTYPDSVRYMDLLDQGLLKIKANGKHGEIIEKCRDASSSTLPICQ